MDFPTASSPYMPPSNPSGPYQSQNINFGQFNYEANAPTSAYSPYQQQPYMNMFTPSAADIPKPDLDDFENEPPLLEELGINFSHIIQKTISVLVPYKDSKHEVLEDADLTGPLVFCLIFGFTLLMSGKVHFNYIYGLGVFGCLGIYLLLTMLAPEGVMPTRVASTLGYCLLPMCLLSSLGVFFSLKSIVGVVCTVAVVVWCSFASSKLFVQSLNMHQQRLLIAYPCALVYSVFALLVVF